MVGGGLAPLTQQPVFSREGVGLSRARRWRNPPELHPATATEAKHSETGSVQFSHGMVCGIIGEYQSSV